jgi:serpin B
LAPDYSVDSPLQQRYVAAANEFGFQMLARLSSNDSTKNVVLSPASIFFALTMTTGGAEEATKDSMQKTLQLQDFSPEEIDTASAQLLRTLSLPDSSVELKIANSLWLNQQYTLRPEFVTECEHDYLADVFVRDFSMKQTVKEINDWVKTKTNGKIPTIIGSLSRNDLLVLLNAVFFHGTWSSPFNTNDTKEESFFLYGGSEKRYPRMSQHGTFGYFGNSVYQAITLPYGNRFSMLFLLPREQYGLQNFLRTLDTMRWTSLISELNFQQGTIEVPRFRIDYSVSLSKTLKQMGMSIAFQGDADFRRMTHPPVNISDVLHKTYLDVNEKGTEAAAVTAVIIESYTAAVHRPSPFFHMIIDHPFCCILRDNTTGLILFAGSIADPKTEK